MDREITAHADLTFNIARQRTKETHLGKHKSPKNTTIMGTPLIH